MTDYRSEAGWRFDGRSMRLDPAPRCLAATPDVGFSAKHVLSLDGAIAASRQLVGFSLLIAAMFFVVEHDIGRAGTQTGDISERGNVESLVSEIDSGSRTRQVVFLSFAALGAWLIVKPGGNRWQANLLLASLIATALLLCLLSIAWSADPSLSLRRVGVVICCMVGAIGIANRVSPREFCLLAFHTVFVLMSISFLLDVAAGSRPWSGADRFGGTLHPNAMAVYCGTAALAAFVLSWNGRRKWIWWGGFGISVSLLLLTKSRTTLAALAATLAVGWFVSLSSRWRWCWAAGTATLCGIMLMIVGSAGTAVIDPVVDVVLLGRHDKVETLSGRVPLWAMLWEYAQQRLLLGTGYSSFWRTPVIQEVSETQQWAITSAHSAYLELVLEIGVIGMLLVLCAVLVGAWSAIGKYAQTAESGYAFIFLLLVYGLANGLLESIFVKPRFTTVLAFCGLAVVAFFATDSSRRCDLVDD